MAGLLLPAGDRAGECLFTREYPQNKKIVKETYLKINTLNNKFNIVVFFCQW